MEQIQNWHKNDRGNINQELRNSKSENDFPDLIRQERKWQSLNFSEYLTFKSIATNQNLSNQLSTLLRRVSELERRVSDEVRRMTPLDRSTQPPLL